MTNEEGCSHNHLTREQYLEKWNTYLETANPEALEYAGKFLHDVVLFACLSVNDKMIYRLDEGNGDKLSNETVEMLLDILSSEFFLESLSEFLLPDAAAQDV